MLAMSSETDLLNNRDLGYDEYDDLLERNQRKHKVEEKEDWLMISPAYNRWFSCRNVLALVAFFGFINVYTLRVNLSEAIVAMVNTSHSLSNATDSECPVPNNTQIVQSDGEFYWSESLQGTVLGSFFYGYICTQIIGGYLAQRYGGKWIFGCGILTTAILALLSPIAARTSVFLFIALRVVMGFFEGVDFPVMHAIWSHWAPKMERTKLLSFTYAGAQIGTVLALPISGVLSSSSFLGGWPSVFYVFGGFGCVWFVFWVFLVYDTPAKHPRITNAERVYIERTSGCKHQTISVPWLTMAKSMPVWAIIVAHFCCNWGFYTMLTSLPTYLSNILHFDLQQNGFLSAVPYLGLFFLMNLAGWWADYIRSNRYLSTRNTRKILVIVGFGSPAILLVTIGYSGCNVPLALSLVTLSVALLGIGWPGYIVNHMDIAPRYAGTLMGISNTFATIPGFVGPQIVGVLTQGHETRANWQIVFYISAAINCFGIVFYCIFGDGEVQWWARDESDEKSPIQ